jgi:hypothetical protein
MKRTGRRQFTLRHERFRASVNHPRAKRPMLVVPFACPFGHKSDGGHDTRLHQSAPARLKPAESVLLACDPATEGRCPLNGGASPLPEFDEVVMGGSGRRDLVLPVGPALPWDTRIDRGAARFPGHTQSDERSVVREIANDMLAGIRWSSASTPEIVRARPEELIDFSDRLRQRFGTHRHENTVKGDGTWPQGRKSRAIGRRGCRAVGLLSRVHRAAPRKHPRSTRVLARNPVGGYPPWGRPASRTHLTEEEPRRAGDLPATRGKRRKVAV